uniref:Craniofacial development protein 2-like n=1 Tax=Nicotiana tabacum TaxID=4097 RepID=A0A1S4BIB8_TOBAC|nr:PREDICTED: craniofacial development protein 2-like [Nicotiana tabacum]
MRVNDKLMNIKLVVGGFTLNIISAYAPQAGLDEEVKRRFWEDLDEMVRDFNGHIGATSGGYNDVRGGFGFGDRNGGGTSLLDFARAFDLVIANLNFPERREPLVTFRSYVVETQIDYLLYRKSDRGLCTDCKVIPRVSKDNYGGDKGDWWWNGEMQGKVKIKKTAYLNLVKSVDGKDKRTNKEHYKLAKKEVKPVVTAAKTGAFSRLYEEIEGRSGERGCSG